MQIEEAKLLREKWGKKPCAHLKLEKEYHFGAETGDYVCTTCGQTDWGPDWNRKKRKK